MMIDQKSKDILLFFSTQLPDAKCELNYHKDYELLIAVVLSSQTTDKSVNKVTEVLFDKYSSLEALSLAKEEEIEQIIKPIGIYKNKAKRIKTISTLLIDKFNSKVPNNKQDLMSLPGVGNKTANVVLCELFKQNEFPVDTHIHRIAKRLNYIKLDDDVYLAEKELKKAFPEDKYILLHHQFIHFGRYICKARNPECTKCKLQQYCNYHKD